MFKINNKESIFHTFSVSIACSEQVIVCWVVSTKRFTQLLKVITAKLKQGFKDFPNASNKMALM